MTVVLYALGAVVAALIGYLVNQVPPIRKKWTTKARLVLVGTIVVLCLSSVAVAQWQLIAGRPAPVAEIQSPADGQKFKRGERVEIKLNRPVSDGHSLWLGYQNEAGGPWIIQAARCSVVEESVDCGPLHVGHDAKDRSAFRLFLFDANPAAAAALGTGEVSSGGAGANRSHDTLPKGVVPISQKKNITLL